jgi:hypothetical protein
VGSLSSIDIVEYLGNYQTRVPNRIATFYMALLRDKAAYQRKLQKCRSPCGSSCILCRTVLLKDKLSTSSWRVHMPAAHGDGVTCCRPETGHRRQYITALPACLDHQHRTTNELLTQHVTVACWNIWKQSPE